jgi:RHS repeat-associated protein
MPKAEGVALISQQRYLPFGGIRNIANGPIATTDFGYTGQRNLDNDLGLMDYKARFYSPYLNHFTQPDSIVPNLTQGLNRYTYVYNRPINFNDPSGHDPWYCGGNDSCLYGWLDDNTKGDNEEKLFEKYEVKVTTLTKEQKRSTMGAIYRIGQKFADVRNNGETAAEAFVAEFNPVEVVNDPNCYDCRNVAACGSQMSGSVIYNNEEVNCTPGGAYSPEGGHQIIIASLAKWGVNNMIHEFGHVYDHQHGDIPRINMPGELITDRSLFLRPNPGCADCFFWQYNRTASGGETFGDMFVAWVYGSWNTGTAQENVDAVISAQTWMNNGMLYDNWVP